MAPQLTSAGLEVQTLTEIDEDLIDAHKAAFGENVDLTAHEPLGQVKGTYGEREADIQDLLQVVYNSMDPDAAGGAALDALSALTGTAREAASASTVSAILTGTTGTLVVAGKQASVAVTGVKFETLADATIAAAAARAALTVYTAGQIRKNSSGPVRIYLCTTGGTSSAGAGPTTTSTDITDGTVHWRYLGDGDGYISVAMESVDTGPKAAAAYSLSVIETAVGGWSGVSNLLDAELGTDEEADPSLRLRRVQELQGAGLSALDAIRARILRVGDGTTNPVTACTVFENYTMTTDGDGLPAKSLEVLVSGGEDQDLFDAVLEAKPAGIEAYGTETGTATDSSGTSHTVKFSRPVEVLIYLDLTVTYDADEYPEDGDDQIKDLIAEYGQTVAAGKDAVAAKITALAFEIPGVLNCVTLIDDAAAPATSATVAISRRQIAVYDTSRISVTSSEGTP